MYDVYICIYIYTFKLKSLVLKFLTEDIIKTLVISRMRLFLNNYDEKMS